MPPSSDESGRLRDQLDEAFQREGEFRLKSAQDFLVAEEKLRAQAQAIAERDTKIHQLNLSAVERDRYVHQLHLKQVELRTAIQALHADIETFTGMLDDAGGRPPASPDLPGAKFVYYLHSSPYRIYHRSPFTLRGWAFPEDGRAVSAVRVRIDEQVFPGQWGLPEPDVVARHGPQAKNPQPGFEIEFSPPLGRHRLRIEACLENHDWVSILNTTIWCREDR